MIIAVGPPRFLFWAYTGIVENSYPDVVAPQVAHSGGGLHVLQHTYTAYPGSRPHIEGAHRAEEIMSHVAPERSGMLTLQCTAEHSHG